MNLWHLHENFLFVIDVIEIHEIEAIKESFQSIFKTKVLGFAVYISVQ